MTSSEDYTEYADKLLVREYVSSKVHSHNLNNLRLPEVITVADSAEEFANKFTKENSFIKSNHASGQCVYFDSEKQTSLTNSQINLFNKWLRFDYSRKSGEKCYKKIKRKLFAEQVLVCRDGSLPDDIKVHCYCGNPAVIQVIRRTSGVLQRKTYDSKWKSRNWFQSEVLQTNISSIVKKDILYYAKVLSRGFPYVRVDFYLVDDFVYFSELTFYPASGSLPLQSYEVDRKLGELYLSLCK
jgi:hypothetical protein